MKTCSRCYRELPESEFRPIARTNRRMARCRRCVQEEENERRKRIRQGARDQHNERKEL
jgi:hypothetical protein